jgi:putative Mg2+ transporter-C (MgtC) family protein
MFPGPFVYAEEENMALFASEQFSFFIRLLLSVVFGSLIGICREKQGQVAGMRTFALVCLGSCLVMVVNEELALRYSGVDPSRMAAQVISGMSFIGVGTIVVTGTHYIRGLVTAASLWATAALGITLGAGLWMESIAGFLLIVFILVVLTRASHRISGSSRYVRIYAEVERESGVRELLLYFKSLGYSVISLETQKSHLQADEDVAVLLTVDMKQDMDHARLIEKLGNLDYVDYAEEAR